MTRKNALLLAAAVVAMMAGYLFFFAPGQITYASAGELPGCVREAFARASTLELYSLDPSKKHAEGRGFHDWEVLGTITLEGAQAKVAREAIEKGVRDSDGTGAKCFRPRHGLRAGAVEMVICFECFHVYVFHGRDRAFCNTTESPASVLNGLLGAAGIPLAAPPK
jgi:hypothetical protein